MPRALLSVFPWNRSVTRIATAFRKPRPNAWELSFQIILESSDRPERANTNSWVCSGTSATTSDKVRMFDATCINAGAPSRRSDYRRPALCSPLSVYSARVLLWFEFSFREHRFVHIKSFILNTPTAAFVNVTTTWQYRAVVTQQSPKIGWRAGLIAVIENTRITYSANMTLDPAFEEWKWICSILYPIVYNCIRFFHIFFFFLQQRDYQTKERERQRQVLQVPSEVVPYVFSYMLIARSKQRRINNFLQFYLPNKDMIRHAVVKDSWLILTSWGCLYVCPNLSTRAFLYIAPV